MYEAIRYVHLLPNAANSVSFGGLADTTLRRHCIGRRVQSRPHGSPRRGTSPRCKWDQESCYFRYRIAVSGGRVRPCLCFCFADYVAVHESAPGPERRLLPALTWSRLGAKQTPLEVARMTRLTQSAASPPSIDAVRKAYSPERSGPLANFDRWQGRRTAGPSHCRKSRLAGFIQTLTERCHMPCRFSSVVGSGSRSSAPCRFGPVHVQERRLPPAISNKNGEGFDLSP